MKNLRDLNMTTVYLQIKNNVYTQNAFGSIIFILLQYSVYKTKTYEESNLFKTFINNNIKKSLICLPLVIDLALHQNVESLTFVCPIS